VPPEGASAQVGFDPTPPSSAFLPHFGGDCPYISIVQQYVGTVPLSISQVDLATNYGLYYYIG
jgi:hypothetical protein